MKNLQKNRGYGLMRVQSHVKRERARKLPKFGVSFPIPKILRISNSTRWSMKRYPYPRQFTRKVRSLVYRVYCGCCQHEVPSLQYSSVRFCFHKDNGWEDNIDHCYHHFYGVSAWGYWITQNTSGATCTDLLIYCRIRNLRTIEIPSWISPFQCLSLVSQRNQRRN